MSSSDNVEIDDDDLNLVAPRAPSIKRKGVGGRKSKFHSTYRIITEYESGLSAAQQQIIETEYKKKSLMEVAKSCFGDEEIDERSKEYKLARNYIAKLKREIDVIDFTPEQKEFIAEHGEHMRAIDIAKELFPGEGVKALSKEHRTVDRYIKALGLNNPDLGDDTPDKDYSPPKADSVVIKRINEEDITAQFDLSRMSAEQKRCVESLRRNLHSKRFISTINTMERDSHRKLFEGTFIASTYDKPDLNAEELNMYISLCRDYVFGAQVQAQLESINKQIDEIVADDDESRRLHMTMVETYSSKMDEYNKIQSRMEKLQVNLSDKRSIRLKNKADVNKSLTRFVELWKDEEERKKAIIIAQAREAELSTEKVRIDSAPEYIAHVMGMDLDEALNM